MCHYKFIFQRINMSNKYLIEIFLIILLTNEIRSKNPWKRIIYRSFGDCSKNSLISTNLMPTVRGPKIFIEGNFTVKSNLPRDLNVKTKKNI